MRFLTLVCVCCVAAVCMPSGEETRNFASSQLFRPHPIKKKAGVSNGGSRDHSDLLEELLAKTWKHTDYKESISEKKDFPGQYAPPQLQFLEPNLGPAILPFKIPKGYFVPFIPRKAFGVENGVSRPPHGHASFYQHRPRGLVDVRNSPAYGFLLGGTKL